MASSEISASVGRAATNRPADVTLVQGILIARGFTDIGEANGVCDGGTVAAIVAYQSAFLSAPDGVVDPGGNTWRHLAASFGDGTVSPATPGSLTRPVPRASLGPINTGLVSASNDEMLVKLGAPLSGDYTSLCQMPTNPRLRRNIVSDTVGPFRVTGLVPAVLSLKAVMADIATEQPAVYAGLGTAGMLCCRLVRGSTTAVSNHSWGTAIDLTLNGVLDVRGDDTVQFGLTLIAPIFNRHGWLWGAAFRTEDGMHFEGGRALIGQWAGQLG